QGSDYYPKPGWQGCADSHSESSCAASEMTSGSRRSINVTRHQQENGRSGNVRFTPNSDRESGHRQTVMSALPPKADMCSATAHVCFGPKADILQPRSKRCYSISSSAVASSSGAMLRPNAVAVLRLITNSNLDDSTTGRSAGF